MGFWTNLTSGGGLIGDIWGDINDLWGGSRQERAQQQLNADQTSIALQNMQMQKDFAQQGVRWRVADAEAAGLHPLAALGASSPGYSPVNLMTENPVEPTGFGNAIRNMSQDISRAQAASASPEQRMSMALDLRNKELNNEYMDEMIQGARWERMNKVAPPNPSGDRSYRKVVNRDGTISYVPTQDVGDAIGNNFWRNLDWNLSNKLMDDNWSSDFKVKQPRGRRGYSSGR